MLFSASHAAQQVIFKLQIMGRIPSGSVFHPSPRQLCPLKVETSVTGETNGKAAIVLGGAGSPVCMSP